MIISPIFWNVLFQKIIWNIKVGTLFAFNMLSMYITSSLWPVYKFTLEHYKPVPPGFRGTFFRFLRPKPFSKFAVIFAAILIENI